MIQLLQKINCTVSITWFTMGWSKLLDLINNGWGYYGGEGVCFRAIILCSKCMMKEVQD